ncbi:MAG: hypothetical protein EBT26_01590 [Microbacteriaceae bacterium]|nr:hypothetical protein [Microbacteriaceae bacterium]
MALVAIGFLLNRTSPTNPEVRSSVVSVGQCVESGTSLVIDFGSNSDSSLIQKCVSNYSGTSWNLFAAAGLEVSGTEQYPVGFVCRINGYPTESAEKCTSTPGATTGSWAFFISNAGKWEYSPVGSAGHRTKCGTAEGWRFLSPTEGLTTPPRVKPIIHSCEK